MSERRGEKIGWIGGWLGGFIWLFIYAIVRLVQGRSDEAVFCFSLLAGAFAFVWLLAPWRHPRTRAWKLMLPLYVLFFGAVAWVVLAAGGPQAVGIGWGATLWIVPLLIPIWTGGRRRWIDGEEVP